MQNANEYILWSVINLLYQCLGRLDVHLCISTKGMKLFCLAIAPGFARVLILVLTSISIKQSINVMILRWDVLGSIFAHSIQIWRHRHALAFRSFVNFMFWTKYSAKILFLNSDFHFIQFFYTNVYILFEHGLNTLTVQLIRYRFRTVKWTC